MRQNLENIYELDAIEISKGVFKQFEGVASFEWILSNPFFWKGVLGAEVTAGAGPYTHTYTSSKVANSMEFEVGFEGETTNVVRELKGSVFNGVTISGDVNDIVRCRGDVMYFEEGAPGTTLGTPAVDTEEPFTFVEALLEIPNGTVIAEVQSFELSVVRNILATWGLNDKDAVSILPQALDINLRAVVTEKDATFINNVLNRTEVADIDLRITNGLSGTSERSQIFTLTGALFGEHGHPLEPNVRVDEDVPITCRTLSIVGTDNTAVHP